MAKQMSLLEAEKQILRVTLHTEVVRLSKSKAAMQGRTISDVVETLLRQYVSGNGERKGNDK